jgi:hypothetical protein
VEESGLWWIQRERGIQGRIQDVKLGGGLKQIVGVFRVKNHDFTPNNHIFSNFRGGRAPPPGSAPEIWFHSIQWFWRKSSIHISVPSFHVVYLKFIL